MFTGAKPELPCDGRAKGKRKITQVNEEPVRYSTERTFSWIIWIFFLHSDIVCRALYIWDNLVIIHYIMCLSGQCCLRTSARVSIFHQLVDFSIDVHTS